MPSAMTFNFKSLRPPASIWILPNGSPTTLLLSLSLRSSFLMAMLLSLHLIKLNSSLICLLLIPPWMIQVLFLNLLLLLTHFVLLLVSLPRYYFLPTLASTLGRHTSHMELVLLQRTVILCSLPA